MAGPAGSEVAPAPTAVSGKIAAASAPAMMILFTSPPHSQPSLGGRAADPACARPEPDGRGRTAQLSAPGVGRSAPIDRPAGYIRPGRAVLRWRGGPGRWPPGWHNGPFLLAGGCESCRGSAPDAISPC